MAKVKPNENPEQNKSGIAGNKLIKNFLEKPNELKPGQVWLLKRDLEDYLPIEVVLTDTEYATSIGIIRGTALTRVKNGGDHYDVVLNKKLYPDTFPNGRVCLRFTDCAFPKDKLEFFIDNLTGSDWQKVKQSLLQKESFYNEPQLGLLNSLIERLSLYRTEAIDIYEKWLVSLNEQMKVVFFLDLINKMGVVKSYYGYRAKDLEEAITSDELWLQVEKNKEKTVNIYEDEKLLIDFIVLNKLPHLIFYSGVATRINSVQLIKESLIANAADVEFSISKDGKFITPLESSLLEAGDWTLKFKIRNKQKSVLIRIR